MYLWYLQIQIFSQGLKMSISSIVGLFKAFLFMFPFTLELFFGKAINPYSRNPKDWTKGKPSKPWVRVTFISLSISSFAINIYLIVRLFQLSTGLLQKEINLKEASARILELSNKSLSCPVAIPEQICPPLMENTKPKEVELDRLEIKPAIKPRKIVKPPSKSEEEKRHALFLKRLAELNNLD